MTVPETQPASEPSSPGAQTTRGTAGGLARISRWCALLVVLLSAIYTLGGGLYGIDAPLAFGHHGYHVGEYSTRARHTLRHGSILPANLPGYKQPAVENHYLHHPILTHQLVTLTMGVIGERVFAVRLAAIIYMLSTLAALVLLLWRHATPWSAAAASVVFAIAPIHAWYGNHIDPGFPGLTCLLLFFYFYFEFLNDSSWRSAGLSLVCALLAGFFEWSPYLAAVPIFIHSLWYVRRRGRFLLYPIAYGFAVALPFVIHVAIVIYTKHVPEMREGYSSRTAMPPWSSLLHSLLGFSDELFGRTLLYLTALYLASRLVAVLLRGLRPIDLVGLSLCFALLAYIKLFPVGVTIHQYRLLYGGVLAAVAVGSLTEDVTAIVTWLAKSMPALIVAPIVSLAISAGVLLTTAKLSWQGLIQSRLHGGIIAQRSFDPQLSRIEFVVYARELTRPGDVAYVHGSFHLRKELYFYLDRDIAFSPSLASVKALATPAQRQAFVLCSPRVMAPSERAIFDELALTHPVHQVDDFAVLDLRDPTPGRTVKQTRRSTQRRSALRRYFEGPYTRLELVN